jgi:hypothetical protein
MRKEAVAAVIAVLVVAALGIGYLSTTSRGTQTFASTSAYTSTGVSPPVYQVVESNVSLHGHAAIVPCSFFLLYFFGRGCPQANNATLTDVELVRYGSSYYYSLQNQSELTGFGAPLKPYSYDVWFTNSTVFCVSYVENGSASVCPSLPHTEETVTIPNGPASTLNSSNGLRLTLNLSTDAMGLVNISVSEFNMLNRANNVTNGNGVPGNLLLWPGGICSNSPIGFEVVKGDYERDNFTLGKALALGVQSVVQCAGEIGTPDHRVFQPQSEVATLHPANTPNPLLL